jgi:hypothetical protein
MLTRRQGRVLAALCFAASGACALHIVLEGARWSVVGIATSLLGTALYVANRLYLHDPEAAAEYRREIDGLTLATALRKYSAANLVQLCGAEYLRGRMGQEVGTALFSPYVRAYGVGKMQDCVGLGVLAREEITAMMSADVARTHTMSSLWHKYDKHVPRVHDAFNFDRAALRDLVVREFPWVTESGSVQGTPDGKVSSDSTMSPFQAATTFGEWSVKAADVPPGFWRAVLRTCPEGKDSLFSHLCGLGLPGLHVNGGLVDVAWARVKFDQEVAVNGMSLWQADDLLDVRQQQHSSNCCAPTS